MIIPIVDLLSPDAPGTLFTALQEVGFVGITPWSHAGLVEEVAVVLKEVMSLPIQELLKYERPDLEREVGYTPRFTETALGGQKQDNKHFYQIVRLGSYHTNVFPIEVPRFVEPALNLFHALDRVGFTLLSMLEAAMGYPLNYLTSRAENGDSAMRLIEYFEADDEHPSSGEHTDINILTIMPAASAGGLEIQDRHGSWHRVTVFEEPTLIVNVGDMFSLFAAGKNLRSTRHRVVPIFKGRRYAFPYFMHFRSEVEIAPGLTVADFRSSRLKAVGLA